MDIDWKSATKEDRAALYQAVRAVADATGKSVETIMEASFGHELVTGTDYLSNFRSGTIGRPKARLIHMWVAENHLETAHRAVPQLFSKPHTDAWGDYLEAHAIRGKLTVVRCDKSMGLVERKESRPKPDYKLKLGEEFCLILDSDRRGYAIGFQRYKEKLHQLPLGPDETLSVPVQLGEQFLPIEEDGIPAKLSEHSDLGNHEFIIAVADKSTKLPTPQSPTSDCVLHAVKIKFEAN